MEGLLFILGIVGVLVYIAWRRQREAQFQEEQWQERLNEDQARLEALMQRLLYGEIEPIAPPIPLVLQPNEKVYYATPANLMKEKRIYEYQGGYSGFSFRVARGVRYHVGSTQGQRVCVGSEIVQEDSGYLIVTNKRLIFAGNIKTSIHKITKIVTVENFADGIRVSLEGRQASILLQLNYPREAKGYIGLLSFLAIYGIELPLSEAARAAFIKAMSQTNTES